MGKYAAAVLADKPVRYYRLGETSGTTALDQSTNLANGTLHGGVTLNQTGLLTADTDPCMLFNGSTGYISLPTSGLPTGSHQFSVEAWATPSAGVSVLVWMGTAAGGLQGILLYCDGTYFHWTTTSNLGVQSPLPVIANAVYHLVGLYDGTNMSLYINAVLVASPVAEALNLAYDGAQIGAWNATSFYDAKIDEVAIYNTALSATQINNHYLAGIGALDFPVVPLTAATRDGHMTTTTRDGLSLTTKTRG